MSDLSTMGDEVCCSCGQPLDATNVAGCNACGLRFHLITRTDMPGRDCGSVWIDERSQALDFACDCCLGRGDTNKSAPNDARYVRHSVTARSLLARRAERRRNARRPAPAADAEPRLGSSAGKDRRGR